MKVRSLMDSLLVGLPGGALIVMGMFLFNALLGMLLPASEWTLLALLCVASLLVGVLARLMQPFHGLASAAAAGVIAALILFVLRLSSYAVTGADPAFGVVGMLAAVGFCLLGAWASRGRHNKSMKRAE
jgi:hypothetical protein